MGKGSFTLLMGIIVFALASCSNHKAKVPPKDVDTSMTFVLPVYSRSMAPDRYWDIIQHSLSVKPGMQAAYLENYLSKMALEEIVGFMITTDSLMAVSYNGDLWCAVYIINGGCSDDGFDYFRAWLISRGKNAFESALKKPDDLINYITDASDEHEFEDLLYIPSRVYRKRTGREIYDGLDINVTHPLKLPQIKFNWKEEDRASMQRICPLLFSKFWSH
jgi:hypothetical protein